jgi:hypothetical protein
MLAGPTESLVFTVPGSAPVTDDLGNVIPGSGEPSSVVARGMVLPSRTGETREAGSRNQTLTLYRLYLAGQVIVTPQSRVSWRGLVLEVVGDPELWPDPLTGAVDHTELLAQVARG